MNRVLLFIVLLVFFSESHAQITKGNWLMGGKADVSTQKEELYSTIVNGLGIDIAPNIGYFFFDKLAGGVNATLNHSRIKVNGVTSITTTLGVGPFVRYYFLPTDNRINLLAQGYYEVLSTFKNDNYTTYNFSAGPVFYFNSSVGLEVTGNYRSFSHKKAQTNSKSIYLAIGFQIHLEKDNE